MACAAGGGRGVFPPGLAYPARPASVPPYSPLPRGGEYPRKYRSSGLSIRFASHDFHALSLTPIPGCFSAFPYGTCLLSVYHEYLALDRRYDPYSASGLKLAYSQAYPGPFGCSALPEGGKRALVTPANPGDPPGQERARWPSPFRVPSTEPTQAPSFFEPVTH